MISYVEASAAAKLLFQEPESEALVKYLDRIAEDGNPFSSLLLETELRRAAVRTGMSQESATEVLERFDIIDLDRTVFREAGQMPGAGLRSLDALHIVTALRIEAEEFVTYDQRQSEAAASSGLRVVAPD